METSPQKAKRSSGHARSGPLLRSRDADAAPPRHRAPTATPREGTRARPRRPGRVALAAGTAGVAAVLVGAAALLTDRDDAPPSRSAVGAGPSAPGSSAPDARPSAPTSSASPTAAATTPPGSEMSPTVLAATGPARTVADARAALEELLAARAEGNLALLRSTWEGDVPAATRARQAVAASSTGLSAVLTTWWDADLAGRVGLGLDQQSEASRAYAAAVAAGDLPAADGARASMAEVSRELGVTLDGVTQGRIAAYVPPQDAAQYRAYVDALQAGDTATADEAAQWLRGRLTREGTALAAGLPGGGPS